MTISVPGYHSGSEVQVLSKLKRVPVVPVVPAVPVDAPGKF